MLRPEDTIIGSDGETTRFDLDADGTLKVITSQDVETILENNKQLRKETQRSEWGRHIGQIPNVILQKWLDEEYQRGNITIQAFGPEMDRLVERKLKDPDWAYLRTDSAQVQGFMGFGS